MTHEGEDINSQNEQAILPRAAAQIDPHDFKMLYDLNRACRWLESEYESLIELWNMCDSSGQRNLITDLLKRFVLVDSQKLVEYSRNVADTIVTCWHLSPDKTRIVAVSDTAEADGSQAFLNSLKNKFASFEGWSEKCFINNIGIARKTAKDGWTYILLDDFFGTGKTIERRVRWFLRELRKSGKQNVKVNAVAVGGMRDAQIVLNALGIDYYCPVWLDKGISGHYKGANLTTSVSEMRVLERKLSRRHFGWYLSSYNFGYGRSEALFCVHAFNVPNNVFPVFWWPKERNGKKRKTIFSRLR